MVLINSVPNEFKLCNIEKRKPTGFCLSPYPLISLIRYIVNSLFNGLFSYINPDRSKMKLLANEGRIQKGGIAGSPTDSIKILFLGDIMVSRSGNPPTLSSDLKKLLKTADIIIANVESPVVNKEQPTKRGISLNFTMSASFLSTICSVNQTAKWVFNIANNHACDTSRKNTHDVTGINTTIDNLLKVAPHVEVIGAETGLSKPVLSLQIHEGPKIGVIGWTDLMNRDHEHYKKGIIRDSDLSPDAVEKVKDKHDILIGFAHGNEEQSYYPLKATRDRWSNLIDQNKFDLIVGHGPHVLHPAEQIGQGLLFHSIGNFCSPYGKSQTKVGCIPEITLHYSKKKLMSTQYKTHITQQQDESVSLIHDLKGKSQKYPEIINRLKKIWGSLSDFSFATPS